PRHGEARPLDTARIATGMRCTIWVVLLLACLLFPTGSHAAALVYDFNEPAARETAPPTVVYDWTTDRCGDDSDIPDQPARAFRNAAGQVIVIATHHRIHRTVGTRLDNIVHECATVATSPEDPDVTKWNHDTWLSAPYTADGTTVYGLSHMEYRGYKYDTTGTCSTTNDTWWKCWYNVLTLMQSTNGGA